VPLLGSLPQTLHDVYAKNLCHISSLPSRPKFVVVRFVSRVVFLLPPLLRFCLAPVLGFLRGEERLRLAASEQEAGGQTRSQLDSQDKGQIKGYTLREAGI